MTPAVPLALPVALIAGIVAGARLPAAGVVPVAAVLAACAGVVAVASVQRRTSAAALVALVVAVALGGAAWGAARVATTAPAPARGAGDVAGIVAVDAPATRTARGARATGEATRMGGAVAVPPGARVLLDLPRGAVPQVGWVIRVVGSAAPASRPGAPAWWDSWLRRQGIALRVRVTGWQPVGMRGGLIGARDSLRRWAQRHVASGLTGDRAAMVRGMALGGGDGLSEGAATAMRDAGLWHLLAVSGQNVAVIGIGVVAALGAAGASRRMRLGVSGAAMLAYCLACDGGASVLRAGLMAAVGLAADLRGGGRMRWNALLLALAAMLAIDPLATGDPGLQLSFAAVVGLFVITPPLAQWLRGWMPGRAADLVAQSAGAGLATAPVLAVGFGTLSVVGLAANLIAVPVAGPVVVIALLGVVGDAMWGALGTMLAWVAAVGASVVMLVARVASSIPGATQAVPAWAAVPLLALAAAPPLAWRWLRAVPGPAASATRAAAAGGIVALAPRAALACSVAIAAWWTTGALPGCAGSGPGPGPAVRMLDVGQGSAVVLRSGARADVLLDAGPDGEPAAVVAGLQRMGADGVGALLLSHGADDHAGGARDVLAAVPVGRVLLPEPDRGSPLLREIARDAARRGVPVQWVRAGDEVGTAAWSATVVGPDDGTAAAAGDDANARSLVVIARAGGLSALVPADAESPALSRLAIPRVDVLQVPHHGSEDDGLDAVLARARPSVALVSAGAGNRFGHPRAQPLADLDRAGARVLRTDRGGDIDVRAGEGGIVVSRG